MKKIDLTGIEFGRFVVLRCAESKGKNIFWLCRCICGNEVEVNGQSLRSGRSKGCGCKHKEFASIANTTHGMSDSREYSTWCSMIARCRNNKLKSYIDYGGRGIKVCDRWINSFENFIEDMGERPSNTSLDRINNDGNYEPSNCRWANRTIQNRNSRHALKIDFNGEIVSLSELCEITGIKCSTLSSRLKRGWDLKSAIEIPFYGHLKNTTTCNNQQKEHKK